MGNIRVNHLLCPIQIKSSAMLSKAEFKKLVLQGIPEKLPVLKPYDQNLNHAPRRKDILNKEEKKLAIKNALRYLIKNIIQF